MRPTPKPSPFTPSTRASLILESLAKGSYSAASLAYMHRFADGEAGALKVCRELATVGQVESYQSRGTLMWRLAPVTAPAA